MNDNIQQKAFVDQWVDAQKMAQKFPDCFYAPSSDDIYRLRPGDSIKICNNEERFWVKIIDIRKYPLRKALKWTFLGEVDNCLITDRPYDLGDMVEFEGCHIYQIVYQNQFNETMDQLVADYQAMIKSTN